MDWEVDGRRLTVDGVLPLLIIFLLMIDDYMIDN